MPLPGNTTQKPGKKKFNLTTLTNNVESEWTKLVLAAFPLQTCANTESVFIWMSKYIYAYTWIICFQT